MKHLTLILATLALVACGGCENPKQSSELYHSIEEIDSELTTMLKTERDLEWIDYDNDISNYELKDSLQRAFEKRMKYHLCNPLTFTEPMPQLEKMIDVITVPSGKYKFYNYWLDGGGTMSCDRNFIQYMGDDGCVHCMPYLNNLRYPRGVCDIWEFELYGTTYYAVKTYRRGMSSSWYYFLEIITIDNGRINTCTEFFTELQGYIYDTEEYYVYDDNGQIIDQEDRPTYYITVCGTETGNTKVGFDFDLETLTVKVKDDGDWTESRTGAVIEREWRLSVPDNDIYISASM